MPEYGLTIWHNSPDAEVDIVFVHGLRGGRVSTWSKDQVVWPKDLLSKDVEKSRIISFGYDSGVVHSDTAEVTQGSLEGDARSLCSLLNAERAKDGTTTRPIITIAHSLGGLVCAQVVVSGDRSATGDDISDIAKCIKGMIFLGTPFGGASVAGWGEAVRRVFDVVKQTDNNTLRTLKKDSHDLKFLRDGFPDVIRKRNDSAERIGVVFFYERLVTYKVLVVAESDASYRGVGEIIPMRTNHLDICKFMSDDDENYKVVKAKVQELIHGKTTVQDRTFGDQYITNNYGKVVNWNMAGGTMNIQTQNNTL